MLRIERKSMSDGPVELDGRRGMAAQKAAETRRQTREVEADQAAVRHRQDELGQALASGPATTWPELGARASYLISPFAATPEGKDPRHGKLIGSVLADIRRLSDQEPAGPAET
jgi:hypothetical protein